MPNYDLKCPSCGAEKLDQLQPITFTQPPCEVCGTRMERTWLMGRANNVIGDECDVTVRHGICNPDGSPRRYTSKAEMARVAKARGLTNYVTHTPAPGTDKNRHTQRFV